MFRNNLKVEYVTEGVVLNNKNDSKDANNKDVKRKSSRLKRDPVYAKSNKMTKVSNYGMDDSYYDSSDSEFEQAPKKPLPAVPKKALLPPTKGKPPKNYGMDPGEWESDSEDDLIDKVMKKDPNYSRSVRSSDKKNKGMDPGDWYSSGEEGEFINKPVKDNYGKIAPVHKKNKGMDPGDWQDDDDGEDELFSQQTKRNKEPIYEEIKHAKDNYAMDEEESDGNPDGDWSDFDDDENIYENFEVINLSAEHTPSETASDAPLIKSEKGVKKRKFTGDVPEALYDKMAYNENWINEKIAETKKWLIIMPIKVILATSFIVTLACLYKPYTEECEPYNSFSEFSIVILTYIILQQTLDIVLASVSLRGMKKVLESETMEEIEDLKNLEPTVDQEERLTQRKTTYRDTDPEALTRAALMGKKVDMYLDRITPVSFSSASDAARTTASALSGKDVDLRVEVNKTNYTHGAAAATAQHTTSRELLRQTMNFLTSSSKKLKNKVKTATMPTLPKRVVNDYIRPMSQVSRGAIGFGGKFLITLNIIPLFSILFYFVVGADSVKDMQHYRKGKFEETGLDEYRSVPSICKATLALNWMIICLIFMITLFRFIPMFYRVIKMAVKRSTYEL